MSSRERAKFVDRILDRVEPVSKYFLKGIERNPTVFQRGLVTVATGLTGGISYIADNTLQSLGYTNKPSTMSYGGGAGGGGGYLRGDKRRRIVFEESSPSVLATPASLVDTIGGNRADVGGKRLVPLTFRTRCNGSGRKFYKQVYAMRRRLALGELNWCKLGTEYLTMFTGTTIGAKGIYTFMHNPVPCAEDYNPTNTYITAFYNWMKKLDSPANAAGLELVYRTNNSTNTNELDLYIDTAIGTATHSTPMPRNSWDLNTCFTFRDMLCYAYNKFTDTTDGIVSGGTLGNYTQMAVRGYVPPGVWSLSNDAAGVGAVFPNGAPDILNGTNVSTTAPYPSLGGMPATNTVRSGYMGIEIAKKNSVLYVDHSTLAFDFTNMETTDVYIDIYELVPRADIPLSFVTMQKGGVDTIYANGGMPDPVDIWQWYIKAYETGELGSVLPRNPDTRLERVPGEAVVSVDDAPATQIAWGTGTLTAGEGVSGIPTRTTTDQSSLIGGYTPRGLTKFFNVRRARIVLGPGSSRQFVTRRDVKRCISHEEIHELYTKAGVASTYMMTIRGEKGIAYTSAVGKLDYGPYQVSCKVRKTSSFCPVPHVVERCVLDIRSTINTGFTGVMQYDAEEGKYDIAEKGQDDELA